MAGNWNLNPVHDLQWQLISSEKIVNKHWLVPRSTNTNFTGQGWLIQKLNRALLPTSADHRQRGQRRFVIFGLGGVGKSEICLKFAEENRDRYV
jgi:hypothetical protein